MAEPLKNLFNPQVIHAMATVLARIDGFDRTRFEAAALDGLDDLEMMQRSVQIAGALTQSLAPRFPDVLGSLARMLHPDTDAPIDSAGPDADGLRGWALVPVGSYVATHGLECPGDSLNFLREMTKRFSAEFAVRPFFQEHLELTLDHASRWARDANFHVRRLASEGSRPRLPWGIRLGAFVADPAPLLPILTVLRDDPHEYVRRSVANSLNDIAKDHADLVAGIAGGWMRDAPAPRQKLVRHACRSLIKAGHPATLAVFGYAAAVDIDAGLQVSPKLITLGQSVDVTVTLNNSGAGDQPVLVDIVMRFLRADGSHGGKVFKWTETVLPAGKPVTLTKRLPLRDVTTRRHYSGRQYVAVQVNGNVLAEQSFELEVPG